MTHPLNRRWPLAAAALIALAAAPAVAKKPAPDAGWQRVTPDASIVGVDGKTYAPSCTGLPGTDPTFKFWAKKSPTGSRKTMVYFEGGGACWNDLTCTFPGDGSGSDLGFYTPAIAPGASPALLDGIFNLGRDDNPVKDWTMVYVPYCTADLHSGMAVQKYANAGAPKLPAQFDIRHQGFSNTMVVLDWVRRLYGAP